jgi:hypothetical protein
MDDKELDKMAKDLEPIEEPKETPEEPTETPTGFVEDKETFVKPDGETTVAPKHSSGVIKEGSGKGKWVFGGLATVLVLALGASTAWIYMDAQNVRNELQSVKSGLDAARKDAAHLRDELTKKPTSQITAGEDFTAFSREYDKMLEASVELTEADQDAIEHGIKQHYKIDKLPEKMQIVLGYKDAKADKKTGKPINALVLSPESDEKPAGFFEMTQDATGKWKYNDLR